MSGLVILAQLQELGFGIIYIYIYTYMCIYIYIYACVCIYVCIYIYTYVLYGSPPWYSPPPPPLVPHPCPVRVRKAVIRPVVSSIRHEVHS